MRLVKRSNLSTNELNLIYVIILIALNRCSSVFHPDGRSTVSGYQDELGNYQFDYTIASSDGEHFHKAATDALGRVVGSYGMTLSDGRRRMVDYVADKNGFRAHVRSNEPGIISAESADASIERVDSPVSSAFLSGNQKLELISPESDTNSEDISKDKFKHTASKVTYVRPEENEEHAREHGESISDYEEEDGLIRSYREPLKTDEEFSPREEKTFDEDLPEKISEFDVDSDNLPLTEEPKLRLEEDHQDNNRVLLPSTYNPPIDPKSVIITSNQFQRRRHPSSNPSGNTHPYPRSSTSYPSRFDLKSPLSSDSDFDDYLREYHSYSSPRLPHFNDYDNRRHFTIPSLFSDRDRPSQPDYTMSTVHGGYAGRNSYNFPVNENSYGIRVNGHSRNYPPPLTSTYQPTYGSNRFPFHFGDRLPTQPTKKPNLVLRTVAIPNGIQAVPVDPETGVVHDDKIHSAHAPAFNSRNHNYNHNHNFPPNRAHERNFRNFPNFPTFRNQFSSVPASAHTPSHLPDRFESPKVYKDYPNARKHHTEVSLSKPSSKDLAHISRVNEHVINRQAGIPPHPYAVDNHPRQRDPPPDYPVHGASHAKLSRQVNADRDYNNESLNRNTVSMTSISTRRPSVAVRLPVSNAQRNNKSRSREYRDANHNENDEYQETNSRINNKNTNGPTT